MWGTRFSCLIRVSSFCHSWCAGGVIGVVIYLKGDKSNGSNGQLNDWKEILTVEPGAKLTRLSPLLRLLSLFLRVLSFPFDSFLPIVSLC